VRKLVIMLALWVAFIPVTRPDGTITYLSTGWVQTVAPVTGGSGCTKTANTVVRLSGETFAWWKMPTPCGVGYRTRSQRVRGPSHDAFNEQVAER
jgi:hypothetical protein